MENTWRYHFAQVCHKWQSYDVWLLKYEAWQEEVFVILGHFLPFYPINNLEKQNVEKMKNHQEISSFYTSAPYIMIICYTVFLRYGVWQM